MAEQIRIQTPLTEEQSRKLKAGDMVLISGKIYSARDAAHKVMTEALARGEELPIDWHDKIVYYLGPSPAKPGDPMLDQGIKGMIGKGSRKPEVIESMKKNGVTYFAAVGGAAALIAKSIKKYDVIAYADLGPEALAELTVEDFPAIVVIDSEGNDFYEIGQAPYREDV
ncbi:MAG: TRZ/ATZ family protein [Veillonella sp.]|nr:MAG: TRZ/ATZ family protein [Veillonella sp.]